MDQAAAVVCTEKLEIPLENVSLLIMRTIDLREDDYFLAGERMESDSGYRGGPRRDATDTLACVVHRENIDTSGAKTRKLAHIVVDFHSQYAHYAARGDGFTSSLSSSSLGV